MRQFLRALFIIIVSGSSFQVLARHDDAHKTGIIKGHLIAHATSRPVSDVQITIPALKQLTTSDAEGNFAFSQVPYGTHIIIIGGYMVHADTISVYVHDAVADLRDIPVTPNDANVSALSLQMPTIALEEAGISAEDDGVRVSNISGLLSASRDPFIAATAFVFGPYRFRPRGYDRSSQEVQINGSPMNDVETGDAYWAQWGGLNDVFRSRSNTYGLQPSEYTFGGVSGSVYFDAAASGQRRQTRITYSLTDRSYRNRIVFTKSSGMMKSGWAYALSLSKRWAKEGYVPGTFYDGYSYYAGVSKRIGRHEFNLITFGAPTRRGKSAPVTQETVDIAGSDFYNPNWGYQNGEKRNAKVANNFQPVTILNYEYAPSNTLRLNAAIGYQSGRTRNSALDYYNGNNPRPDYYRYLPSYYILTNADPSNPYPGANAEFFTQQQINWGRIYDENRINFDSVVNAAGIAGNIVRGRRSITVLYNDVDVIRKYTFNTNLTKVMSEHVTMTAGIQAISQRTESYRELLDLLGGDFYLNLNQFAFQQNVPNATYNQYDLNIPDRVIRKGDKYNYDYINRFTKSTLWGQATCSYNKVDFFLAVRGDYDAFSREGLYRNGLFADESYGKSNTQHFTTYACKGGATYKLDGRNYFFVNGSYGQDAPTIENTFISPRTRNGTVANPVAEKTGALEAGYLMRTPKYNLRAVGYATDMQDAAEIKRYYNDDPAFRGFVNYVMQGISTRYTGLELAAEMKVSPALSVTGVAAIGEAFYTANPTSVAVYRDNDTQRTPRVRNVYIKNYYLAAGPQSAYTLGLNYRSEKYWYASMNANYFDRNYIDVSPDQRTEEAVAGVEPGSRLFHNIVDQEQLPAVFTIDMFGGKSWLLSKYTKKIPRGTFLYLNAGISNLLNAHVRNGGFEQLRYDFTEKEPDKFATKYFYGLGRNFFINLSLKF